MGYAAIAHSSHYSYQSNDNQHNNIWCYSWIFIFCLLVFVGVRELYINSKINDTINTIQNLTGKNCILVRNEMEIKYPLNTPTTCINFNFEISDLSQLYNITNYNCVGNYYIIRKDNVVQLTAFLVV